LDDREPAPRPSRERVRWAVLVRSFLLGLLAALGLIVALVAVDGPGGALLLAAPLVALGGVAVFGSGVAGWRGRAFRGVIGAVLAGAGGLAAIIYLKTRADWFDWPADSAGDLFLALLTAHAAIPGGLAAAAAPPSRGLALAAGF